MSYEYVVHEFYGNPIVFLVNDEDVFIGAKSVCSGMGLNWNVQYIKLKNNNLACIHMDIDTGRRFMNRVATISRGAVSTWLDSINKKKVADEKIKRIELYQNEFVKFSFDAVSCEKQIEKEDFYIGTREGLKQLMYDSIIHIANQNAIDQLVNVLDPLLNEDFVPDKLPLFEKEHAPQTRKSFMRILEKIRLKILDIPNPIYDMAEKTAARTNELEKIKSQSTGARLEQATAKLREYEEYITDSKIKKKHRDSILALEKISKGLYGR